MKEAIRVLRNQDPMLLLCLPGVVLLFAVFVTRFAAAEAELPTEPEHKVELHTETDHEGRTVLSMESEPEDRVTVFFTTVKDQVQANIELDRRGLKTRWTLVAPEGTDQGTAVYLDLEGPYLKRKKPKVGTGERGSGGSGGGVATGAMITIRF